MKPFVIDPAILQELKEQSDWLRLESDPLSISDLIDTVHCLDAIEFLARIPDNSVDMVLTDEPYGIEGSIIAFYSRGPYATKFDFDNPLPTHLIIPWVFESARILKPSGVLLCCGIESWSTSFQNITEFAGLEMRKQGVWAKTNPPTRVRHGGFKSSHERIWIASKGSLNKRMKKVPQAYLNNWIIEASCPDCATRFPVTWSHNYKLTDGDWWDKWITEDDFFLEPITPHHNRIGHPNEKPNWLPAFYLDMLTKEGDIVVDSFAGSGTFAVMAKQMGRHYIANDFNPKYAETIAKRLANLQKAMF